MKAPRVLTPRKILIASLGVATVTYACGGSSSSNVSSGVEAGSGDATADGASSGNLVPPPGTGGSVGIGGFTSGNLMPPPGTGGNANIGGSGSAGVPISVGGASGNLMPPPGTGGVPADASPPTGTGGTQINLGGASSGNLVPPPPVPSI